MPVLIKQVLENANTNRICLFPHRPRYARVKLIQKQPRQAIGACGWCWCATVAVMAVVAAAEWNGGLRVAVVYG